MAGPIDNLTLGKQAAAFLVKEENPSISKNFRANVNPPFGSQTEQQPSNDKVFIFQYWPTQVTDTYDVEYATKSIPGGSHPLYQWIGGSGRSISFEALFTSEVDDSTPGIGSTLIPSHRYTVDVAAALARLRTFQLPTYKDGPKRGSAEPPPRLRLFFPNSGIGGDDDAGLLCFLKSVRITMESCFPNGRIRVATVALEFLETVQQVVSGDGTSAIKFIGSNAFEHTASKYTYKLS